MDFTLVINPAGGGRCLYDEALNLSSLGSLQIERASHVEPDAAGRWFVDLSPVGGPVLGPYATRSFALEVEAGGVERQPAVVQAAHHVANHDVLALVVLRHDAASDFKVGEAQPQCREPGR